jgi:curli biogenesis system outer membrane secretion channel CsgG
MGKYILLGVIAAVLTVSGCATQARPAARNRASRPGQQAYTGPRALISVTEFEVASPQAGGAVDGLRRMLIEALVASGRFAVSEPGAKGQQKTPELTITASVTEFEPQASGGNAGIGGGGGVGSGLMGGLLGPLLNKAHMALNIRVVDTANSQVLASEQVQGQATDAAIGFMSGFYSGWELDQTLAQYANTPMEKAIRICMIEAIRSISKSVPENYYRHK